MVRGFILGSVSGLAFAAVVLGSASLIAPQPAGNAPPVPPETDLAQDAREVMPAEGSADPAAAAPDLVDGPALAGAPEIAAPGSEAEETLLPAADTAPAEVPEASGVAAELADPVADTADAASLPAADAPLTTGGPAAPQVPAGEPAVEIATTPAERPAPPAPALTEPEAGAAAPGVSAVTDAATGTPAAGTVAAEPADAGPAADTASAPPAAATEAAPPPLATAEAAPEAPAAESGIVTAETPVPPLAEDEAPVIAAAIPAPDADAPPAVETGTDETAPAPAEAADEPPAVAAGEGEPLVAAEGAAPEAAVPPDDEPPAVAAGEVEPLVPAAEGAAPPADEPPAVASDESQPPLPAAEGADAPPAGTVPGAGGTLLAQAEPALPGGDTGIRVNRPGSDAAAAAEPAPPAEEPAADLPPLEGQAAAFDNPQGLPLLSIVLIDDGSMSPGAAIIGAIPFPVTVALDPGMEGAAATMQAYRAEGIEVAALVRLPASATAADLDVTLQATFAELPQALALVDAGSGGLAADRTLTETAARRLADQGRGLAVLSEGLNPALRDAERDGAPVAAIYRDLDAEGQDARVIRRFIDQAAFRARQDGAVVLVARLRPETISALTLWGTANRAGEVAMAPLSAVLTAE